MTKLVIQIPFDQFGNQQHYPEDGFRIKIDGYGDYSKRIPPKYVDNFEFEDTLTYETFNRGRSSAYFIWSKSDGTNVTMFMSDLDSSIKYIRDGKLTGRFTFCKRGANFGIKFLG